MEEKKQIRRWEMDLGRASQYTWPDVFVTGQLPKFPDTIPEGHQKLLCCAYALEGWGLSHMAHAPANFGEGMANIAILLGVTGTPESFMEYSKAHK